MRWQRHIPRIYVSECWRTTTAAFEMVKVARPYRVSEWGVYKLLRQTRETGCTAPRRGRSGPQPEPAGQSERLREVVRECPDATLPEWRQKLGVPVGLLTLWRALRRLRLTRKEESVRCRTAATCGKPAAARGGRPEARRGVPQARI